MKNTIQTFLCLAIFLITSAFLTADELAQDGGLENTQGEQVELTLFQASVLGLVEGLTEYLPVSSTGHLILAAHFLGLSDDTILLDKDGAIIYLEQPTPSNPAGVPLTVETGIEAYTIIIQFGAIAAIVILYWKRLLTILFGILGKDPNGLILLRNLILAFIPAAIVGLLFESQIDRYLFGPGPVVAALFVGGIVILIVDRWHGKKAKGETSPDLHELSVKNSLFIGLLQCFALWPGTSRSLTTIIGGYLVRLSPTRAAEFSFLLGLVTLSAASIYKSLKFGEPLIQAFGLGMPLLGCIIAAISAAIAVKWMVGFLGKHGLAVFGYYRIIVAIVLALVFYL